MTFGFSLAVDWSLTVGGSLALVYALVNCLHNNFPMLMLFVIVAFNFSLKNCFVMALGAVEKNFHLANHIFARRLQFFVILS